MDLEPEKVFRLSGNGQFGLECHSAVHVRQLGCPDEGVAAPRARILPGEPVGPLAFLHESRNPAVVIRRHIIVRIGLGDGFCDLVELALVVCQLSLESVYPVLVVVVFLPQSHCVLDAGGGYLFQQSIVFFLQCADLRIELINL